MLTAALALSCFSISDRHCTQSAEMSPDMAFRHVSLHVLLRFVFHVFVSAFVCVSNPLLILFINQEQIGGGEVGGRRSGKRERKR